MPFCTLSCKLLVMGAFILDTGTGISPSPGEGSISCRSSPEPGLFLVPPLTTSGEALLEPLPTFVSDLPKDILKVTSTCLLSLMQTHNQSYQNYQSGINKYLDQIWHTKTGVSPECSSFPQKISFVRHSADTTIYLIVQVFRQFYQHWMECLLILAPYVVTSSIPHGPSEGWMMSRGI